MTRALVVDDSAASRSALRGILEGFGIAVHEACDGANAVQQLKSATFDLAFVDIHMPVLDGPGLIRVVRAHEIHVRVVLITTGAPTSMIAAAVKLGVSDYVRKPFDPEQVKFAVARALGMDAGKLHPTTVRVLLQADDEVVAQRLREALPAHVEIDMADPDHAVALARSHRYPLAIVAEPAAGANVAARIRSVLPLATILTVEENATPERWWHPSDDADGTIPRDVDDAVREFLYRNFLRCLVFPSGAVYEVAGFEGDASHLPAYFAAIERALAARCLDEESTQDLVIDLRRVPQDTSAVAALIRQLHDVLDTTGLAPAFRVPEPILPALTACADLRRVVLFSH